MSDNHSTDETAEQDVVLATVDDVEITSRYYEGRLAEAGSSVASPQQPVSQVPTTCRRRISASLSRSGSGCECCSVVHRRRRFKRPIAVFRC